MSDFLNRLIRVAYESPETRDRLLPLIVAAKMDLPLWPEARKRYYRFSDGISSLKELKGKDAVLDRLIDKIVKTDLELHRHLNQNYIWD